MGRHPGAAAIGLLAKNPNRNEPSAQSNNIVATDLFIPFGQPGWIREREGFEGKA
jgi:hypothetical protein